MMIERVDYEAQDGRKFRVEVPLGCLPEDYDAGIPVGPPDMDALLEERGWSKDARVRLHNQLFSRGLFTYRDVCAKPQHLEGALKAALKTDMVTVHEFYRQEQIGS